MSSFSIDWTPFLLSFKLAALTTAILLVIGLPVAWFLSQNSSRYKPLLEALVSMPIVLPPTVLGFYILWALSSNSPLGAFFERVFGIHLVFNFTGLVIGSVLYSFPFMVQPIQNGFESIPKAIIEASLLAGKGKMETIFRVVLPNMKPALLTATIVTFAHTIGEFGVVLMVGGSIPGKTKVASIAIYELVETMDYTMAHIYSAIMVAISFTVLLLVYIFHQRYKRVFR